MRSRFASVRACRLTTALLVAAFSLTSIARAQASPATASSSGPGARQRHAMTYDAARREVLLFGGAQEHGLDDGLWAWNGARWRLLARGGPPARIFPLFAFDVRRGRAVLHAGEGADTVLRDTWEWDGQRWHHRDVAGPPKRAHAAMAYDPIAGRTIVTGGTQGEMPTRDPSRQFAGDDTWTWDGERWAPLAGTRAPGRSAHAMAWDARRGAMLVVGGSAGEGRPTFADVWELAADGWRRVPAQMAPRHSHTLISLDTAGVLALGGADGAEMHAPRAWYWDGSSWRVLAEGGPPPMWMPGMAWDASRRRVVVHGGGGAQGALGDTWELDPASGRWVKVAVADGPRDRDR